MAPWLPQLLKAIMSASGDSWIGKPSPYFSTLTIRSASLSPWMASASWSEV
jgi:hypothetical protein